jgi:hypothetical protein
MAFADQTADFARLRFGWAREGPIAWRRTPG